MNKKQEDIVFKDVTEKEVEIFLKRLNIKSKKKKLNPTEIRFIDAATLVADIIIELDEIILIIEFQSTNVDLDESFVEYNKLILYINNIKKIQEIKLLTGIEDLSIQYMSCYKWGNFLIDKIYRRIKENKKVKDTGKDIHKVVQDEYGLEDKTIVFLENYIYEEHLFLKLYRAICEEKVNE